MPQMMRPDRVPAARRRRSRLRPSRGRFIRRGGRPVRAATKTPLRPNLAALKKLLRPSLVIPATLAVAVLGALVVVSNPTQVLAVLEGFHYPALLPILALMLAYEAARCAQWVVLLRALGVHVSRRTLVFSFLGGEIASFLPIGTYFRNYLLGRAQGTRFSRSSAATTLSLVSEIFLCLAGVAVLGLGTWSVWLRPLVVGGVAAFLLLAWAVYRLGLVPRAPRRLLEMPAFQRALDEVRQFRAGAAALWHPRVLAAQAALGALYLLAAGTTLYAVLRGLGLAQVTLWQALAVFFFSLAFFLISPVSVGMIEVSGVAALVVVGVREPDAVGAMLAYRVLRTGFPLAIALAGLAVLHREVRAALRERRA
jgi:uncharacterized membrane protein YbhN (UPF0104 family)